ncbi:uncharacterized protein BDZ83DRAFT_124733 [Colletotrichum acutatum]|uniref:Uncharacterized protein n=1 Tax=Glomerella acutata TaxID=27357 RepID=A0AAD8XCJ8_GLOAC|nr:uncharacterized protein BDZ83DRAFT_124733 [Colletotrichum acutatum]KAK1710576.1 hypothetical protein BDZ83DRAFT_124733 [Colletotrichum acutatum]
MVSLDCPSDVPSSLSPTDTNVDAQASISKISRKSISGSPRKEPSSAAPIALAVSASLMENSSIMPSASWLSGAKSVRCSCSAGLLGGSPISASSCRTPDTVPPSSTSTSCGASASPLVTSFAVASSSPTLSGVPRTLLPTSPASMGSPISAVLWPGSDVDLFRRRRVTRRRRPIPCIPLTSSTSWFGWTSVQAIHANGTRHLCQDLQNDSRRECFGRPVRGQLHLIDPIEIGFCCPQVRRYGIEAITDCVEVRSEPI